MVQNGKAGSLTFLPFEKNVKSGCAIQPSSLPHTYKLHVPLVHQSSLGHHSRHTTLHSRGKVAQLRFMVVEVPHYGLERRVEERRNRHGVHVNIISLITWCAPFGGKIKNFGELKFNFNDVPQSTWVGTMVWERDYSFVRYITLLVGEKLCRVM